MTVLLAICTLFLGNIPLDVAVSEEPQVMAAEKPEPSAQPQLLPTRQLIMDEDDDEADEQDLYEPGDDMEEDSSYDDEDDDDEEIED